MTTKLTVHTKPGPRPDQFATYWCVGNKQGVVETTLAPSLCDSDPAVIAELAVIQHLLSHKGVCGSNRAGNALTIEVTFGAIKKLAQNASSKAHLYRHGRFLLARYADATICVQKKDAWISPAKVDNRREQLSIDAPIPDVVEVRGFGPVGISYHIIDRMMQRANYASVAAAWRHLITMLGSAKVAEVAVDPKAAREKAAKHGTIGHILSVAREPWRFVLAEGRTGRNPFPMLVTAYIGK